MNPKKPSSERIHRAYLYDQVPAAVRRRFAPNRVPRWIVDVLARAPTVEGTWPTARDRRVLGRPVYLLMG
jgi:hypothetical protein